MWSLKKKNNNIVNHNKNKNNNRKIEIKNLLIPTGFYYINTMNKNLKKWKGRKPSNPLCGCSYVEASRYWETYFSLII